MTDDNLEVLNEAIEEVRAELRAVGGEPVKDEADQRRRIEMVCRADLVCRAD